MFWWKKSPMYPAGALLTSLLLGAVSWGEIQVTSVTYDTANLPCSFPFIQGVENLLVVWEKKGKDGKIVQVYKSVNGQNDLSNQDSQFKGRTVFSRDMSQGNLDLTLVGVTWNDEGVYYCRAANKINHGDNVVTLSVSALPPQMIQRAVKDDVTLVPKFSGVPTEINWKLNNNKLVDMELEPTQRFFYRLADRADLQRNGSLTIRHLTKEDSGVYKSEAIVNNFIQETEIWLTVLDRVSKPIIVDRSTNDNIILLCESSTINASYKWLVNGSETISTYQEYTAPRPKEEVTLSCTVNNMVSEDIQSITVLKPSDSESPAVHINYFAIFPLIVITTAVIVLLLRYWKLKKYKRDAVETTLNSPDPSSNNIRVPGILVSGYICDENMDKIPIEGFQMTEEDEKDAAELKYTGNLLPKQYLRFHELSSDSDYFSDINKESHESDCVLEGFQKTEEEKRDSADPTYIGNIQCDGYTKFYKIFPDGDYISEQSKEAPGPVHVLEKSAIP